MARLIKTSGEIIEVSPKNGTDFSLEELQEFVGGYIEIVNILTGTPKGTIMVVNEEGKLRDLEINGVASAMVGFRDIVVGDVLVCDNNQIK